MLFQRNLSLSYRFFFLFLFLPRLLFISAVRETYLCLFAIPFLSFHFLPFHFLWTNFTKKPVVALLHRFLDDLYRLYIMLRITNRLNKRCSSFFSVKKRRETLEVLFRTESDREREN